MGFKTTLTEGAKHILGWKSPDYIYSAATAPGVKLLLTNDKFSLKTFPGISTTLPGMSIL